MALMEVHYSSFAMGGNVTLNVFVPTPGSSEAITEMNTSKKYDYESGLPVVYLLHGAFGDAFSWIRYSNIDRYAQDRGIVVVMASAENSFYQDLKCGRKYYTFFTEELPTFIQSVFPVSKDRSKTFVAGFSMGGYGAWYLGLSRPDLYAKAASMSGAIDIATLGANRGDDETFTWENSFSDVLQADGSLALAGSKYDPFALYDKAKEKGLVPKLYMACGKDDFLYQSNLHVKEVMEEKNADFKFVEDEGAHDWDFWDKYIQDILDWLLMD
ncbi:MAG: esterase family protein [Lachnospiraceae bacterium]|nr:esterase family protein [Lachnospiraceae bacterium]